MTRPKSLLVAGLVLASCAVAASSRAGNILRIEYLTVNRATALPGVVLPPGTYVFEAIGGHPDIVRVSDRSSRRVLYAGYTDLIRRPDNNNRPLVFGEAPTGEPVPIRVWFPAGTQTGHEFRHR
jgi:hypothetical protein